MTYQCGRCLAESAAEPDLMRTGCEHCALHDDGTAAGLRQWRLQLARFPEILDVEPPRPRTSLAGVLFAVALGGAGVWLILHAILRNTY